MAVPPENPMVFLDIRIGEELIGRVVLELFQEEFPNTVRNFLALISGEGRGSNGQQLSYKGTRIFKVVRRFAIQGGDVENNDGTGSDTIYGKFFPKELPFTSHTTPGLLGMASNDSGSSGSQFYITTVANCTHLDGKSTVFGRVMRGMGVISQVECITTTHNDVPIDDVVIDDCGVYHSWMPLGPEDSFGEDVFPPFPEDCPPTFLDFTSLPGVLQVAERVRIVGNYYYKSEQYIKANSKYKKALRYLMKFQEDAQSLNHDLSPKEEVDVTHAVIHNLLNSAACKIKLQLYDQALENCNEALDSVPNHVKALYRRGQAYHGKREYERAVADLLMAQQLEPSNHSIIAELKACRGEMTMYKERERRACQRYFSGLNNAPNGSQAQASQNSGQQPEAMLN